MGMFDSFIIEHDGIEREIQTKEFFRVMDRYRVGDVIPGADPGIQIIHDFFYLDSDGGMTWVEDEREREIHVFISIRFGVFMVYQLAEGALEPQEIERRVTALQLDALNDSAGFELICIESLKRKTDRIRQLSRAVHAVIGAVQASKMSDDEVESRWFVSEQDKRAQAGQLVEVLEEILSEFDADEDDGAGF